jgi:hypothetical protein
MELAIFGQLENRFRLTHILWNHWRFISRAESPVVVTSEWSTVTQRIDVPTTALQLAVLHFVKGALGCFLSFSNLRPYAFAL